VLCGSRTGDGALVCWHHTNRLRHRLADAADLWPERVAAIARQVHYGDPVPRAGRPAPPEPIRPGLTDADWLPGWPPGLPVDLAAADKAAAVRNTVTTWARHVAEVTGALPPTGTADLLRWLAGRLDWLRHRAEAAEVWDELDAAAFVVRSLVFGPSVRTRFAVGPCPETVDGSWCSGVVVAVVPVREDRPARMVCGSCGAAWSSDMWARAGRRIMARMREAA
jgi:hypothetical protein